MSLRVLTLLVLLVILACSNALESNNFTDPSDSKTTDFEEDSTNALAKAAHKLLDINVSYDPSYFKIPYPNGDIPKGLGVCSDVIIRAYRELGLDLQQLVHEDMEAHFEDYPNLWKLKNPDPNIDHRRVPNLMKFFDRQGARIGIEPETFIPGDVVAWNLGGAIKHIGIVSSKPNNTGSFHIIHNIGSGQVLEDVLFQYRIIGHYRWKSNA